MWENSSVPGDKMSYDTPFGTPLTNPNNPAQTLTALPLRQQVKIGFKDMGTRSYSMAKNFGKVGALFSGIECGIEGLRAKNDLSNGVAAGCLTGGILAKNAGPQAMLGGCAAFAAFSAAIDAWMRPPKDEYEGHDRSFVTTARNGGQALGTRYIQVLDLLGVWETLEHSRWRWEDGIPPLWHFELSLGLVKSVRDMYIYNRESSQKSRADGRESKYKKRTSKAGERNCWCQQHRLLVFCYSVLISGLSSTRCAVLIFQPAKGGKSKTHPNLFQCFPPNGYS